MKMQVTYQVSPSNLNRNVCLVDKCVSLKCLVVLFILYSSCCMSHIFNTRNNIKKVPLKYDGVCQFQGLYSLVRCSQTSSDRNTKFRTCTTYQAVLNYYLNFRYHIVVFICSNYENLLSRIGKLRWPYDVLCLLSRILID